LLSAAARRGQAVAGVAIGRGGGGPRGPGMSTDINVFFDFVKALSYYYGGLVSD
jgi:hypothetical protein